MQEANDDPYIGDPITDTSEIFEYLCKIVDCRLADDICAMVRTVIADPERKLTVDATFATLATALATFLIAAPESDHDVLTKASWLHSFIVLQVSTHRHMRKAMNEATSEADDATHH